MMSRRGSFLYLSLAVVLQSPASAVTHVVPGAYPNAFQDMIHHPSAAQMRAHGNNLRAALTSGSSGPKNVAVIIVQFPAGNSSLISGGNSIVSFSNIQGYFTQMQSYYKEVSYNNISLNFVFFNNNGHVNGDPSNMGGIPSSAYTMAHPEEYYGCGDEGQGCTGVTTPATGANGNYLIRDAIIAARNGGSTGLVSKDNGGTIDSIIVVHAGNGNETTQGRNGDIWSIFYSGDTDIIGGKSDPVTYAQAVAAGFSEGDVDPETETSGITSPLGVMCHEFGHSLGLPDLYNTSFNGGTSVVGKWELMDEGPYAGPLNQGGTNPSHMCVWDKVTLGWITPILGSSRADISLSYIETSASALKIPVLNGFAQEYFLVEYRSPKSGAQFDQSIPGTGLLIWHVDDAITSSRGINATTAQNTVNTGSPHYGVSIVAADGDNVGSNGGDSGNPFTNGANFIPPFSNNFSGQASGISLVNIAGVGTGNATSQVANLEVSASQSILKLINYPNPAGKGYAHPSGAGHTTIQMQLSRPANDYAINIYTLSGELVRKLGPSDIILNLERSADEKWVYEYVWDLKNGSGAMVAPGVYLYLARADGVSKSNKAVIIR